jgi:hypothetical protein
MPFSHYAILFPDPHRPGCIILYSTREGAVVRVPEQLMISIANDTRAGHFCRICTVNTDLAQF